MEEGCRLVCASPVYMIVSQSVSQYDAAQCSSLSAPFRRACLLCFDVEQDSATHTPTFNLTKARSIQAQDRI
jgi:hypothetical protein